MYAAFTSLPIGEYRAGSWTLALQFVVYEVFRGGKKTGEVFRVL